MFNFLFDGKIGELLAPVGGPSHAFFLAIQHHKNEVQDMLLSDPNLASISEGGHSAIHQACRYNNIFVLELLMSRGISVEFLDQNGNSPLHFAAKYGHHDLCKWLVEKGAFAGRKNISGQTPYDVAQNHVVRQYLLPLQFQSERSDQPAAAAHGYNSYTTISDSNQIQYPGNMPINNYPIPGQVSGGYGNNVRTDHHHQQQQQPPQPFPGNSVIPITPVVKNTGAIPFPGSTIGGIPPSTVSNPTTMVSSSSTTSTVGLSSPPPVHGSLSVQMPPGTSIMPSQAVVPQSESLGGMPSTLTGIGIGTSQQSVVQQSGPLGTASKSMAISSTVPIMPMQSAVIQTSQSMIHQPPPVSSLQSHGHGLSSSELPDSAPPPPALTPPLSAPHTQGSMYDANRRSSGPTNARMIQPDGFHSSASDPELQKKYGHVKPTINIAPPPTAMTGSTDSNGNTNAPPPFSMYAAGGAPVGFNRYVAYNPSLPNQGIYGAPPAVTYNNNNNTTTTPSNTFAPPTAPGIMNVTSYNTMGGSLATPHGTSGLPPRPTHQQQSYQIPRPINVFDPTPDAEVTNISNQSNSIL